MKITDWIQAFASVVMAITAAIAIWKSKQPEKKFQTVLNVLALTGCINASTGQILTLTTTNIKDWMKKNPPDTWDI